MFDRHYRLPGLPLPLRVSLVAYDRDGEHLQRGELRQLVDPLVRPAEISRAIATAKRLGLISADSSAGCLKSKLRVRERQAS
jgi:hypothetical protein